MTIHAGRSLLAAVALLQVGAVTGAAVCAGWLLIAAAWSAGLPDTQQLLGILAWGAFAGAPVRAVALPLLGLSILRSAPIWKVGTLPAARLLAGLLAPPLFSGAPATGQFSLSVVGSGFAGLVAGTVAARVSVPALARLTAARLRSISLRSSA